MTLIEAPPSSQLLDQRVKFERLLLQSGLEINVPSFVVSFGRVLARVTLLYAVGPVLTSRCAHRSDGADSQVFGRALGHRKGQDLTLAWPESS